MPDDNETCAHEPCTCAPQPGSAFCSDFCRHAATGDPPRIDKVCACGHPDCGSDE